MRREKATKTVSGSGRLQLSIVESAVRCSSRGAKRDWRPATAKEKLGKRGWTPNASRRLVVMSAHVVVDEMLISAMQQQ